ncbi:MAG: ABC transporter permease, partial [Chloroflexota bacterium]
MATYVIRRLLWLPVLLLIVSFSTFTLARYGPGDPVSVAAGQIRDPAVLAQVRASRGLDQPIPQQYMRWLNRAVRGDLGESYLQRGYSVSELIFPKMWISAQLGLVALIIVFAVGIPLGLLAARLAGTWADPAIIGSLLFLQAIPVLVIIPPLIWLFAVKLQVLPAGGWDGIFALYW